YRHEKQRPSAFHHPARRCPVFSVIFATLRDSFRWPQKGTNFVLGCCEFCTSRKQEVCFYEIPSHQALSCGWGPQNQRESGRCVLEQPEGDRRRAPHDIIGLGRRNRFPATAG